ncbi:amino acid/amide ABC transporter membrane protein 2, HAAT family [Thermanaeromonas toyohensis ToBE]|uniref:Amino acid/amide ABC transporter membrane protein 2, HAAT family n=1 Tax=Thermanaeromonas toyohensis ToBE TaxID=698762 RepID=A0A1W1VRJ4_9FIRM|nr:branched-chain amino acid ABC transporter permease [Thermanaeromonas toyohensis]SMB95544.1 amino acid/amide ABC transporter membrane protein 2, HAAT family [Thermanaeromonas toyohensis ToBE]
MVIPILRRPIVLGGLFGALYVVLKLLGLVGLINDYWQRVLDQALITTIGALGLSIIYGFAGQFSLGHAAFYGIGAYTAGVIGKVWGHGNLAYFLLALLAGVLMAGFIAFLLGIPILRLRSDYLGIATLGFGVIVRVAMENSNKLYPPLGGATGMTGIPQVANFDWIFWFAAGTLVLVCNLVTSSYGRAWLSIREDEIAADALGIDTTRYKILAFVLGCALAGLAGGLYAYRYPYLHPSSFDFLKSFDFLLIVVLGGLGSISGTVVTAIAWVFLLEGLRIVLGQAFVDWRGIIYALILIVTILLRPQGLFSGKEWRLLFPSLSQDRTLGKEGKHASFGG